MQMQELTEIATSMEIMGKAYIEIAKKNEEHQGPVSIERHCKEKEENSYRVQLLRKVSGHKRSQHERHHVDVGIKVEGAFARTQASLYRRE